MKKSLSFLLIAIFATTSLFSQNLKYTKDVLEKLCAPEFFGRGYVNDGGLLAAEYMADELAKWKVKSFNGSYFQNFEMPINSQTRADLWFDGEFVEPTGHVLVEASSPSLSGTYPVITLDAKVLKNSRSFLRMTKDNPKAFYLLDSVGLNNRELYDFAKGLLYSSLIEKVGIIEVVHRYPFGVPRRNFDAFVKIQLQATVQPEKITEIRIENENTFIEKYPNRNVIGYIPGKTDEWIVYTAHYDGMGMYGNVLFPGANDNGSGTAMVIDLARHYATGKKSKYSVMVMLCAGEEAGLIGSNYYVNHPLFPMKKIRMVVNLDMVASGQTGCTLFNGTTWPMETDMILKMNEEIGALPGIRPVGPAANSDHHPFHAKGVPAIFFITSGKVGPGHTAFDFAKDSWYPQYDKMFTLITNFVEKLSGTPEPVRYPLVDYHIHLKGDMTREVAIEKSQKSGIQYGVAVNCGVGFPVNDDAGALAFLESMKDSPFLLGMQAEGREWVNTFSKSTLKKFDYVFTDAMTYTNADGKRMRLWMPDEVEVKDNQKFMDDLTNRIVGIISKEPIDIYVNPTFLPETIADQYDALWTTERMDKVIAAAKKNKVAIEINNRYKLPSEVFIKRAKKAGVKFAFGTNNTDSKTGDLNYCREMIAKCGLVASDMWSPKL